MLAIGNYVAGPCSWGRDMRPDESLGLFAVPPPEYWETQPAPAPSAPKPKPRPVDWLDMDESFTDKLLGISPTAALLVGAGALGLVYLWVRKRKGRKR